jgi:signal transduction histidine kinase
METILGESFLHFVIPRDQARARELLAQTPTGRNRGELTLQGGQAEVAVGISLKELMLDGELRLGVVISDITERKQAEEALRTKNEEIKVMSQQLWQTARLATMGELGASIANELSDPLATVSQHTEMLSEKFPVDDPNSKLLQVIESEIQHMNALVENLLTFSRRSYPMISPTDVREEVMKTLDIFQHQFRNRQIAVVQEFTSQPPWVRADRQQLRQVFLNLFNNAIDSMPGGGTLTIRIWEDQGDYSSPGKSSGQRRITGTLAVPTLPPPYVVIEIADTGEGIPADVLKKIWEPFFTTKSDGKGTGLGLGICQRIVLEHGGRIELLNEDAPRKGTRVKITLPISKAGNGQVNP